MIKVLNDGHGGLMFSTTDEKTEKTPVEMAVLFTLGGIAFFGVGLWLIFRTPDTWERSNPWAEIFGGILALVAGAILILNAFIVFAR